MVRKKSTHTAAETAATIPASRRPAAATATTTRTSASAASVFGKLSRNGIKTADSASGAARPASASARSQPGLPGPVKSGSLAPQPQRRPGHSRQRREEEHGRTRDLTDHPGHQHRHDQLSGTGTTP